MDQKYQIGNEGGQIVWDISQLLADRKLFRRGNLTQLRLPLPIPSTAARNTPWLPT